MQGHSEDWVESRILRSLGKRGMPDGQVVLGRDSFRSFPFDMQIIVDAGSVGRAVVGFVGGEQLWTLLGTDAIYSKRYDHVVHLKLDDILELTLVGNTLFPPQPADTILIIDDQGNSHSIWGPSGEGCLALCGVLQILLGLRRQN